MNEKSSSVHEGLQLLLAFDRREGLRKSADPALPFEEHSCTLFCGSPDEVEIQLYAANAQELEQAVVPLLRHLLHQIDQEQLLVQDENAYLAIILLRPGRLGLHYWENGVNNEFTRLFDPVPQGWVSIGYGSFFDGMR